MASPGRPPQGVLLDLDDVLVPWNSPGHWQWAWRPQGPKLAERHVRFALRRALRGWDRRRWHALVGSAPPIDPAIRLEYLRETLTSIAGHALPPEEIEAVITRFDRPAGEIESFDDVAPGLARLTASARPVGVVTELPEAAARWALKRVGLASLPLVRHAEDPVEARLPARAGFRAACAAIGSPASETLFVGDLFWSDVRAAARAGLTSFLLDRYDRFGGVEARRIPTLAGLADLTLTPPAPEAPEGADEPAGPGEPGPEA